MGDPKQPYYLFGFFVSCFILDNVVQVGWLHVEFESSQGGELEILVEILVVMSCR